VNAENEDSAFIQSAEASE